MKRIMLTALSAALVFLPVASFAGTTTQYSEVIDLEGEPTATGAASLVRSKKSISGRISTTLSMPGLPVTVWYIIFNKPHKCVGPIPEGGVTNCGFDDVFISPGVPGGPADPAVINATGGISADDGVAGGNINLVYALKTGQSGGGENEPCCFGTFKKNNGHRAEVHLLVDEHRVFNDWITDLFFPNPPEEGNQRGVIFLPLDNDDDSDSD